MPLKHNEDREVAFEESLQDDWSRDLEVVEVPLGNKPLTYLGIVIVLTVLAVFGRIIFLSFYFGDAYRARAEANLSDIEQRQAPRGLVTDRFGKTLAENQAVFLAALDMKEFLRYEELREKTLQVIQSVLGLRISDLMILVEESDPDRFADTILLNNNLDQNQVIQLKSLNLPTLTVESGFKRYYPDGPISASFLGYTGLPSSEDLKDHPNAGRQEFIGKAGIESFYNDVLRGEPGISIRRRDARGNILEKQEKSQPKIGTSLRLTIDSEFQKYFYTRLQDGLASLGRQIGVGLALDPQSGEVLALVTLPSFDNNLFVTPGNQEEKQAVLVSPPKPLFNRAVSGFYNPGSTIKPLVGVAALHEGVITPEKTVFSPGYLDVPNPYDPEKPTRFLDWRYQGDVDISSAIAQSSNVYFYTVGGGFGDIRGLGINRLREWWGRFGFGKATGIGISGEADGFLPSVEWKEKKTGKPWLLGDTYNVSIGQGDILVTPIQILNYIAAIANGGKLYEPVVRKDTPHPTVLRDLSYLGGEIKEVKKGMRAAVEAPLGTAHLLSGLGFSIGAKTGTAQIKANTEENAFFVGYAPFDHPQIAILVLVENSREGSLNAVPIAKDVLNWYYWNRIKK